jgi:EAL domain-containing protein (putative c-di-GMP-specific phosphodiesterase class I)
LVGLELIAEGIERAEQIAPIVGAGCAAGQGFLFARPVEASAMTVLLAGGSLIPPMIAGPSAA